MSKNTPPGTTTFTVRKIEAIEVKASHEGYDARRDDTATKIVVTEDGIIKYDGAQLADVLKRLPSIAVIAGDIRMRGLGNGCSQILLNSERAPLGFPFDTLSPGMINIILKKKVTVA